MIIALSVPGEEHTTLPARHVLDKLKDSGASLHVFLVAGSAGRPMANVTKPSALLEENMNLGEVLGDGSKQSGGTREDVVASAGGLIGLQRLAEDLLHQYVIDYDLPRGHEAVRQDLHHCQTKGRFGAGSGAHPQPVIALI